ncbi:MAG: TolC family protein [Treponema sp.]|nr:TolC family protein [Treponema sp.]
MKHVFLNRRRIITVMVMGTLLCGSLVAQEQAAPRKLSQDEAVDLALKNNLSLESARVATETRRRASALSWNQFIPSVTVGGNLILDNERTTTTGMFPVDLASAIPLLPPDTVFGVAPYSIEASQWHVAGSVQASLNISIAMFENKRRLRLDCEGGMIAFDKAKLQLERDVRKAYNTILLLQENINLMKENFEAAQRRVELARANYRAGLAPELVLLQAQVAMENMRPVIDQVENGFRLAMAQFAMFLGLPYDTPFELPPIETERDFIPLDLQNLISRASSGKPDIQELRHTILMLQSARKAQVFSLLPFLNLNYSYTPTFLGDPWKDSWGEKDLWRNSGGLTITLGIRLHSLLPFSTDFQGIKNMDDQIRTANIGLAQMIQGTEIEIYNTILSLERTQVTAEAQSQTVSLAERSYRLTEEAYRAGLQDLLQVQNAQLELRQARVSMLEQQFNYLNGLIDLEYSVGVPFGTLASPGSPSSKESE